MRRQVAAARVAHQDIDPTLVRSVEPGQDVTGQVGVVEAVTGNDDVDIGRFLVEHVATDHGRPAAVGSRIESHRSGREGIDVGAGRRVSTSLQRSDRAQARP